MRSFSLNIRTIFCSWPGAPGEGLCTVELMLWFNAKFAVKSVYIVNFTKNSRYKKFLDWIRNKFDFRPFLCRIEFYICGKLSTKLITCNLKTIIIGKTLIQKVSRVGMTNIEFRPFLYRIQFNVTKKWA